MEEYTLRASGGFVLYNELYNTYVTSVYYNEADKFTNYEDAVEYQNKCDLLGTWIYNRESWEEREELEKCYHWSE